MTQTCARAPPRTPGDVTAAEELEIVRARIAAQQTSGVARYSVSTSGTVRTFDYIPIEKLWERERELLARIARQTSGGMPVRLARFPSGW